MAQIGFYLDMKSCIGCKVCQIACKDKNQLEIETNYRQVTTYEGGRFPNPWVMNFTMACNHCGNPKCVEKCPVGALYKREKDGIVELNKNKCIGCKSCREACPYNAIQYLGDSVKKVGKCNLCSDLIEKGEMPACVAGCLMRALQYGDIKELIQEHGSSSHTSPINLENTKPSYIINPKK